MNKNLKLLLVGLLAFMHNFTVNGSAVVTKFRNLRTVQRVACVGTVVGVSAFAYSRSCSAKKDEKISVRTNVYDESMLGLHEHVWVKRGEKDIGEAGLVDCKITSLSVKDESQKKAFFNAVLRCTGQKCLTISNYSADQKLYNELKACAPTKPPRSLVE